MRIWGKPPDYIQNRRNAARLKEEREKHEKHLVSIDRIADALESTKRQEQTEDSARARREIITIWLLIFTVIFTGLAAFEAHRLVGATNEAIAKADLAAETQNKATIAALAKAETANQNTSRLIAANEKLASVNRSIIFISARMDSSAVPQADDYNYIAKVYFMFVNKGTLPASITDVKTALYMGHSWIDRPINLDSSESMEFIGNSAQPSVCTDGTVIEEGTQAQLPIDARAVVGECQRGFLFKKKDIDHMALSNAAQGDIVKQSPRVFWFYAVIKYQDITGTIGETSYLAEIRGNFVRPIDASRNYISKIMH